MNISSVFGVHTPAVHKYKAAAEGLVAPDQVIGLELETENCGFNSAETWRRGAKIFNYKVETDGSLRGNAYEFISLPMRSDHALAATTGFWEWAEMKPTNYTDRCSVHVHANCTDMTLAQVSSLALLYTVVEEILFEFVGANRDTNIYCIPWNQCRQHLNLVNNFLTDTSTVLRRWNKYTALNLIPLATQGTVEFRHMHGMADPEKLKTWLNIIGALMSNAKTTELKDLITDIKSLNSTSQYEAFFNRVLKGSLPYNAQYREKLEAGIIFAKYSLISMETKRGKPSATAVKKTIAVDAETAIPGATAQLRATWAPLARRPERVVVNPATAVRGRGTRYVIDPLNVPAAGFGFAQAGVEGGEIAPVNPAVERVRQAQIEAAIAMQQRWNAEAMRVEDDQEAVRDNFDLGE